MIDEQIHPSVDIELRGDVVQIDVEIAEIVALLNRDHMTTITSCQGDGDGRAYIEFFSVPDAAVFLSIAASEFTTDLEGLWNRICHDDEPERSWKRFRDKRVWSYGAASWDYSVVYEGESPERRLVRVGESAFDFRITVMFPRSDIPRIVELLREADDV